ncbi:MAG: PIN domain-containing protein [Flavobacterium sp.]
MNLVIDTNIVFSAILNPNSNIGDLLLNFQNKVSFYAPEFLLVEIEKYTSKIEKISNQTPEEIEVIKSLVLSKITFISEELIFEENWKKAYNLTIDVDENDTPFVVLALQLNAKLWSGDKKLNKGLLLKQSAVIYSTQELIALFAI